MTQKTNRFPRSAFQFLAPASIERGAQDTVSDRQLTGVAYSGEIVTDHGYWNRLVIDLASIEVNTPIPLLCRHDQDDSIGVVTNANTGNGNLAIQALLFASADNEAAKIAAKADKGFPWQLSVGIWPSSIEEVNPDVDITLNNRTFKGPLTIFRGGRVREISVCAIGADSRTSATVLNAGDMIEIPFTTHEDNTVKPEEAAQARIAELEAKLAQFEAKYIELSAIQPDPAKYVPVDAMKDLQAKFSELSTQVAEKEINELVTTALAAGKLLPAQKAWAESLGKTDLSALKGYLQTAPVIAALKGMQTGGKAPGETATHIKFKAPAGYQVDEENLELHAKVIDYQAKHGVDYLTALTAVGA